MIEPLWISRREVEALHFRVIEIGGGSAGVRDDALLASALARPKNLYAYGERDIFQLAASYAEAISQNHAFVDGNKRTAFVTAVSFLDANEFILRADQNHEHSTLMENLAQGKLSRTEAAEHFEIFSNEE